jgi:hypothetical protein
MIPDANKSHYQHNVKVEEFDLFDTMLLPVGYPNHTKSDSSNLYSKKFQQQCHGPFQITKAIGTNTFKLERLADWKTYNLFNESGLKQNHVDNS